MAETNWAGNIAYGAARFEAPASVAEVQSIVAASSTVRAIGSRHSFNAVADTAGDLVSLASLPRIVELDPQARTVTIDGGVRYGELATGLDHHGWALANLASLPHISVAGACATATHGSGAANGNLSTAVQAIEVVTASGELVDVSRDDDPELMDAITVGLGAFGIITRLTLAVEPTFAVRQYVDENVPMQNAIDQLDEIMADGYSVSLFTTWRDDVVEQLWRKRRVDGEDVDAGASAARYGGTPAVRDVHPILELPAEPCTAQMGIAGPWHERLPHFRMGFTPSSGDELQSEVFVSAADAPAAMKALVGLHDLLAPVLKISEVRAIAADGLWLSPCYRRDSIAFHFTWVPSWPEVLPVLAQVEAALEPFAPRPHWGKLSTLGGHVVRSRYERMQAFGQLVEQWDPERKFRNSYLDDLLG
ncbi:MAG TPA: FAD-binding protein [Ilumatobacteraceae bacterium]|jgi:xylitol oxidase